METKERPETTARRPDGDAPRYEVVTTMRGREVRCWLEDGRLRGDEELLRRLSLFHDLVLPLEPVDLAHLVADAVGSDVVIRVDDPHRDRSAGDGAPT